jgi:hypothetical protein
MYYSVMLIKILSIINDNNVLWTDTINIEWCVLTYIIYLPCEGNTLYIYNIKV